jgi:hypothetical protein
MPQIPITDPCISRPRIQETLLHTLNAHQANWPTALQTHALSLLRSGEVTTFPALVRRVLDDVRHQTASSSANTNGVGTNGSKKGGGMTNGGSGVVDGEERPNLALPQAVVDDALRVTRESLEMVCEIEGEGT